MGDRNTASLDRAIALVPFGYQWITRIATVRDVMYLVAGSWIPGIWLIHRLGDFGLAHSIIAYLLGYLAFVSIYELGYFANDAWDSSRSDDGRSRIGFRWGAPFLITFVAVRLSAWAIIGYYTGWINSLIWIAGFAALAAAFTEHNLIRSAGLRAASFTQLAILRFMIPVIGAAPSDALLTFAAAIIFYFHFRYLSYLDGKGLLRMEIRKRPDFQFVQSLMLVPMVLFLALVSKSTLLFELSIYFLIVSAMWAFLKRKMAGA